MITHLINWIWAKGPAFFELIALFVMVLIGLTILG
jgi:hypothetical protein